MVDHPTLLWHPAREGSMTYCETVLPLDPDDYHAIDVRGWWIVIVVANGEKVYQGRGPVKIYRAPTPWSGNAA
jgi:hypothetical protein